MNLNKDQKTKIFLAIPEEVRATMSSMSTANMVLDLGKRNNVSPEKISSLAEEIGDIMLGINDIKDLPARLAGRLNVEPAKAEEIKKVIELTLLSSIKIQLFKARETASQMMRDFEKTSVQASPEVITQKIVAQSARQATAPDQIPETHPYHLLEKAKVLAEIERPAPNRFIPPNAPIARPPMPVAKPTAPTPTPAPQIRTLQKDLERGKTEGTFANIISQKLAGPTTISQIEKVVPPTTNPRVTDPYRETI